jgi:peptide/nickel transport system permease protein
MTAPALPQLVAARRRRFVLDWRGKISAAFLLCMLLIGIFAPWISPYSSTDQDITNVLVPANQLNWLGTDDLGRDILSRLIYGTGASLYATFLAVSIASVIGIPIGLAAGFFGGWLDEIISRLIDALLSFPGIVLAIGVTGALGIGLTNAMIAVGIVFSPTLARLVRARTLIIRSELYIDAARCFGASNRRVLLYHVLPNALQPLLVQITLLLAAGLLAEASLSFLGLGVQAPVPSWGAMLARGYTYMEVAPEQMFPPGLAILLTALAFNALGESLRVALDPSLQSR